MSVSSVSSTVLSSTTSSASTVTTATTAAAKAAVATSAASSTTKALADIEKQLAEFAESSAKENKKAAEQAKLTVQTFEKQVRKSPYATNGAATDIGTLVRDSTRLNVYSNIKDTDKGDVFKFRVRNAGDAQIGVMGDPGLRYQVMTRYGAVIADSKEGVGPNSENFVKMQKGEFKLSAGDYYVKVTHDGTTPTRDSKGNVLKSKNYGIQLSMGVYSKDYDTVAQQAAAGNGLPTQSAAQLELQNMLTASENYGTGLSGTAKLSGALYG